MVLSQVFFVIYSLHIILLLQALQEKSQVEI